MKINQIHKIITASLLFVFSQAVFGDTLPPTQTHQNTLEILPKKQTGANAKTREKIKEFCVKTKPYQDIVINGEIIYQGWNTQYCSARYNIVQNIIKKISARTFSQNPFKQQCPNAALNILELGAAQGYFSFRLAHDFGATCFMVENGESATQHGNDSNIFVKDLCRANHEVNNVFLLDSTIDQKMLSELQRNDRFDIILAMSMIHHLDDWQECLNALIKLGEYIIVELPDPDNGDLSNMIATSKLKTIHTHIINMGGTIAATTSRFYKGQTSTFYILAGLPAKHKKEMDKTGISLYSFMQLNGQWPILTPAHFSAIDKQCAPQEIYIKNTHTVVALGPCRD